MLPDGPAAAVTSSQEVSSFLRPFPFLSPIFVVSCSASLSISLLSSSSLYQLQPISPPSSVSVSVSISVSHIVLLRLSWSTSPPNPSRASGFLIFRFSHLLSASALSCANLSFSRLGPLSAAIWLWVRATVWYRSTHTQTHITSPHLTQQHDSCCASVKLS